MTLDRLALAFSIALAAAALYLAWPVVAVPNVITEVHPGDVLTPGMLIGPPPFDPRRGNFPWSHPCLKWQPFVTGELPDVCVVERAI